MSGTAGAWAALSPRERRVVGGGALVAAAALLVAWGVVPYARAWRAREAAIAQRERQATALAALVRDSAALARAAAAAETALAGRAQRLLAAASPALAAAGAQSLLQEYADRSRVTISRLDVAAADSAAGAQGDGPVRLLPVTLSGTTDIVGVAELLAQVERGPRRVHVTQLTVQANPALRGAPDVLQLTLALAVPWVRTP